jgi:hypothetical protein
VELLAEAAAYKRTAFAETTKSAYMTHLNTFLRFCIYFGRAPVPADRFTLMSYVAFLARTLKPTSINCYLNVIRIIHLEAGLSNPLKDNFEVNMIRRGVARQLGAPPEQKLPLTIPILSKIFDILDMTKPGDLSFWAACLTGFFGLMRKSTLLPKSEMRIENCILSDDVINLCADSFVLQIRHSKTIQFGQRVLQIPFFYCESVNLCPVRALMFHLIVSPLPSAVPLFHYLLNGRVMSLTHSVFVTRLRSCLRLCGVEPSSYSGHSFRRGGCTMSFEAGLSLIDIKMRGDWKSHAFERYIHVPQEMVFSAARALSTCAANQCTK